ncbi:MAG: glucosyl-3-phosphoglycerate synthase [Actinomycetota bacterium]|nr:glucosyl-3-phosphoglycerate synthase [Actinomycetota bacterium]
MQNRAAGDVMRMFRLGELDARALVDAKDGQRVSVCLPARNEEATVGPIVQAIRRDLVDQLGLVDEVVVVDDHSSDATAAIAASAGARVIDASRVLREYGQGHGKGEALWKSLYEANGDLIVWCDADIRDFDSRFIVGLVGPLLVQPELQFVKGYYERPMHGPIGGGRVTELVARPLLSMFFPELASVVQPLAGEYAIRRSLAERLAFIVGYGVDIGVLIDTFRMCGVGALAQVDLGVRQHRNRSLDQLGPQALAVIQAVLDRAGVSSSAAATLLRPGMAPVTVTVAERRPLLEVRGYRASA